MSTFKMVIVIVIVIVTTSCTTTKTVPTESIRKDTIYINKQSYDSIYIDNTHLIDRGGDTVYIKDKLIEYRFRSLRDTIRIARIDSIPYEVKIIETKEVRKPPNLFDYLCYLSIGIIIGAILWKLYRVIKFL